MSSLERNSMNRNLNVVFDFADAINTSDVDRLYRLMTNDHVFIDSHDQKVRGKDKMKQAWTDYFLMFPDYKIEINEVFEKDPLICLLGYASGTYKNIKTADNSNHWRIPAAWTAIIQNDQVKQWQVYADNIIVMDIIKRNQ